MLTKQQVTALREQLEQAQRPVFLYDNDADGLCSYLLLRRFLGRGEGFAVKSYPGLDVNYAKKVQDLQADAVFVLDKPVITREFFELIAGLHVPVIWIDHHQVPEMAYALELPEVFCYNPLLNPGKSSEPVTSLCYQLTQRKEDLWIAVMGCIADHYLPDFAEEFSKAFPEYWGIVHEPFDAYYGTEIGRIAQALSFGLKDTPSHVQALQNFLVQCKGPSDVFLEIELNTIFRGTYKEIRKKYDALLLRAEQCIQGKLLFFDYAGETSISAELANELSYRHKQFIVAVAYRKGGVTNISLRGSKVKLLLEKLLVAFPEGGGGGHMDAVGARIPTDELGRFQEALREAV